MSTTRSGTTTALAAGGKLRHFSDDNEDREPPNLNEICGVVEVRDDANELEILNGGEEFEALEGVKKQTNPSL